LKAQSISPSKLGERPEKLTRSINLGFIGARRMTHIGPMTALVKPMNKLAGLLWNKEDTSKTPHTPFLSYQSQTLKTPVPDSELKGKEGLSLKGQPAKPKAKVAKEVIVSIIEHSSSSSQTAHSEFAGGKRAEDDVPVDDCRKSHDGAADDE